MIFPLVLGLSLAAVSPGVGQFPQIDLEAEEAQKEQHGPHLGSETLQIISAPDRHKCPQGQKFIDGRCRKVFMVQNKTIDDDYSEMIFSTMSQGFKKK